MYTIILNPMSYKNDNLSIITDKSFTTEWEINYDICKLIEKKILEYSNIKIIYTTKGEKLHISERLDIINSVNSNIVLGIQSTNIIPSKVQYNNMDLSIIGDTIAYYINAEIKSDAVHRKLCTASYIHIILANEIFTEENKDKFATDIVNAIVVSLNLKNKEYEKNKPYYVVRKSFNDISSQLIKTSNLEIAKQYCNSKASYNIYNTNGNLIYKSTFTKVNTKQIKSKVYGIVNSDTMLFIYPNKSGIVPITKNTKVELLSRKNNMWMILYNNNIFYINKQCINT